MTAIVITGGAGFIGSNIAARLSRRAADIVVADWLGQADEGKWRNIAQHDIADIIAPGSLLPYLEDRFSDIDAIIHMGAASSTTETDVDKIIENNFRFSARIWDWCARRQKPLIYASSAATYGAGERGFRDDNEFAALAALRPLNAYGYSKYLFDLHAVRESVRGNAPPRWSGLKFFNVYGPNEQHKGSQKSVVAHMYPRAAAGEPVRLFRSHNPDYADGGQKRDFIYVRDCVDVVEWLLDGERQGGVLNVGTGKARTFYDLAASLYAAMATVPNIQFVDTPAGIREKYQYFTEADMSRLRELGYDRQFAQIEDGVADYVTRYLAMGAHA
jgi:ADP-L-glycero-D-manno-heptose 6-epimerase